MPKKVDGAHPHYETEKVRALTLTHGDLYALSDLSHREIAAATALIALAKHYDIEAIADIVATYVRLKVSLRREGRKELLRVGGQKHQNILQFIQRKRTTVEDSDMAGET